MSVHRKLRISNHSTQHSPRVSTSSHRGSLVRQSLKLSPNVLGVDRSLNASQATDRSHQSPRILKSQKNSPRRSIANSLNRSMVEGLKETNSYLDTSYKSVDFSVKGKKVRQNSTNKKPNFGFSFYKMPNCQYYNDCKILTKFLPGKRSHFLNDICKSKQFVPSPDKYEVRGNLIMKDSKKRVFGKLPRLTMAAEIIKKGSSTPGPGTYRQDFKKKKKQEHFQTNERSLGFISEAEFKGKIAPQFHDSNFKLIEKKPRFTNFRLSTVERSVRIEKEKGGLSPCSYDPLGSFKKTQLISRVAGFGKNKIPNFSDVAAKAKKFVPPPGSYDISKGETKIYRPSVRKRR